MTLLVVSEFAALLSAVTLLVVLEFAVPLFAATLSVVSEFAVLLSVVAEFSETPFAAMLFSSGSGEVIQSVPEAVMQATASVQAVAMPKNFSLLVLFRRKSVLLEFA